jgi:hypothetical protein
MSTGFVGMTLFEDQLRVFASDFRSSQGCLRDDAGTFGAPKIVCPVKYHSASRPRNHWRSTENACQLCQDAGAAPHAIAGTPTDRHPAAARLGGPYLTIPKTSRYFMVP